MQAKLKFDYVNSIKNASISPLSCNDIKPIAYIVERSEWEEENVCKKVINSPALIIEHEG
jgi:hypothetical protein